MRAGTALKILLSLSVSGAAAGRLDPACSEAGLLSALPGILGSMMAMETMREIVGFGEGLTGRLLMIDSRAMRFETLTYEWDQAILLSGENPTITDLPNSQVTYSGLVQLAIVTAPFITDQRFS